MNTGDLTMQHVQRIGERLNTLVGGTPEEKVSALDPLIDACPASLVLVDAAAELRKAGQTAESYFCVGALAALLEFPASKLADVESENMQRILDSLEVLTHGAPEERQALLEPLFEVAPDAAAFAEAAVGCHQEDNVNEAYFSLGALAALADIRTTELGA